MKTSLMLAAGLLLVPLAAHAAPTTINTAVQFQTIDSVNRYYTSALSFTGIAVGQTTSQAYVWSSSQQPVADSCERDMLLMITHPGRYILTIVASYNPVVSSGCTLTPNVPTPASTGN